MKYLLFSIGIAIMLFSCKQEVEEENEVTIKDKVEIVEPTHPKETEVWEPIPPTVNPTGQNAVPSDAIVLFDGTNFDEWVNAADSTAVKWELNKEEKSMTVVLGKEKTPWFRLLNGNWKFHFVEKPADRTILFYEETYDDTNWDNIPVPSNWEMKGYSLPL